MAALPVQTRALVLRTSSLRESDRLVDLFTRECGLVRVVGTSVRESRSKLRYALEPYSLTDVTLVRGRDVWRVRGASAGESFYRDLKGSPEKVRLVGNIIHLIGRLIAGEEQNAPLFDSLEEALSRLSKFPLTAEELKAFESIVVLRMLSELGYRLPPPAWQRYLDGELDAALCREFVPHRLEAVKLINEALAQTHL